jgi:hypothetical protein
MSHRDPRIKEDQVRLHTLDSWFVTMLICDS